VIVTQHEISKVCRSFKELPISEGITRLFYQSPKRFIHPYIIIEWPSRASPGALFLFSPVPGIAPHPITRPDESGKAL
jgi:hypothetical protein